MIDLDTSHKNILIIKPSSLGDIIHGLPVLEALYERYPRHSYYWLANDIYVDILSLNPHIKKVIPFPRNDLKNFGVSRKIEWLRSFYDEMRSMEIDIAIDLQGLMRSAFISMLSGARIRLSYPVTREFSRFFYTHRVGFNRGECHAIEENLSVLQAFGINNPVIKYSLNTDDSRLVDKFNGWPTQRPVFALQPGGQWETKRWPHKHFSRLARLLHAQYNASIILIGSPDEYLLGERIIQEAGGLDMLNLMGKTMIYQLPAILSNVDIIIANDSGPLHLAVALGTKAVGIYGPTDSFRTGIYGDKAAQVTLNLPCQPCMKRKCKKGLICLQKLSPEVVMESIKRLMDGSDA